MAATDECHTFLSQMGLAKLESEPILHVASERSICEKPFFAKEIEKHKISRAKVIEGTLLVSSSLSVNVPATGIDQQIFQGNSMEGSRIHLACRLCQLLRFVIAERLQDQIRSYPRADRNGCKR